MPALAVIVVAWAWWASGLEPFSGRATAAVLGAGVVALLAGRLLLGPVRPPAPAAAGALRPWAAAVAALAAWQLVAWVQGPRSGHPTLSSLANDALDPRPLRALALAAWLGGAAWLGRRR